MQPQFAQAFKARYVFPVSSPPLADGVVMVEAGRIVGVSQKSPRCPVTDLGNAAILPGLINAHTHLELSVLTEPLGRPGIAFTDWVRLVVEYRRGSPPYAVGITTGLSECVPLGQVVLADVTTTPWNEQQCRMPVQATIFQETIGLRRERITDRLAAAQNYLSTPTPSNCRLGLNPHAPYSVHPELFDGLVALAASANVPLAFHLAETPEERELLATGGGPFRDLLVELEAWEETAISRGTRPFDYLRRLADSGVRSLVIHGNYLDDDEIDLLGANAVRITVVYCPRTHGFFGHARHPLPRLLATGANVALGTDSRASNPDLNLFAELQHVAREFPEIPPSVVLEMATLRPARALALDHVLGTIEPGKAAALATVALPDVESPDPYLLLLASSARSISVLACVP
jgi:cytosine/adenosine deaminase-related metal-dependent hydrolase